MPLNLDDMYYYSRLFGVGVLIGKEGRNVCFDPGRIVDIVHVSITAWYLRLPGRMWARGDSVLSRTLSA